MKIISGVWKKEERLEANVPLPNAQNSSNMSYIWASGAVIVVVVGRKYAWQDGADIFLQSAA